MQIYSDISKGLWLQQKSLSKKNTKNHSFWMESVLKYELWQIKDDYFPRLLEFSEHDMTSYVIAFLNND